MGAAQPQVLPEYKLLVVGYVHDEYVLDLYGCEADADDEAEVFDATLTGTTISLCNLVNFSRADLMRMTDFYIAKRDADVRQECFESALDGAYALMMCAA